jgi:ribosomal protein S18 acetylase RimI-like enzyme
VKREFNQQFTFHVSRFLVRENAMSYTIRPLTAEDEPWLWEMLYHAAHMEEEGAQSPDAARANPELARYVAGWGRAGDLGRGAIETVTGRPIGAAWLRLPGGEHKGYAYIDDEIPELSIAVLPTHTAQGIGTDLLTHLFDAASAVYPAIALSVRASNPARRLYERMGFVPIEEMTNRVGGQSLTMKRDLNSAGKKGS